MKLRRTRVIATRVIASCVALAVGGAVAFAPAASSQRPNIVMLMTDDTGWNDSSQAVENSAFCRARPPKPTCPPSSVSCASSSKEGRNDEA